MRKPDPTTLILAAGAAALGYALARAQGRITALEAENVDLWHEGQDERQRAELLTDDLADERQRARKLDAEWRDAVGKLGRTHSEVSRLHDTNRRLLDGFAADANRRAERQEAGSYWTWTPPRCSPSGLFDGLDDACDDAEAMAQRYPGQDVYLLAAMDRVRFAEGKSGPVWDVERSPLALEGA